MLTAANTYDGTTTINDGALRVTNSAGLGVGGFAWTPRTEINSGGALELEGNLTLTEHLKVRGDGVGGTGAIRNVSGNSSINTSMSINANTTFGVDAGVLDVAATIYEEGGTFGLTKVGAGTLVLSGANSYAGGTDVDAGTLIVNGSVDNSFVTIASGAMVGGNGSLASGLSLAGMISPGNSIDTLSAGNTIWMNGGGYLFEIDDATGVAGQANGPGWDLLDITGTLDLSGLTAGGFLIDLDTLLTGGGTNPGAMANFAAFNVPYGPAVSWEFVRASGGIVGTFDSGDFAFDLAGVVNPFDNGSFSVTNVGNSLFVTFTPVPEPGTWALMGVLLLAGIGYSRRKRQVP